MESVEAPSRSAQNVRPERRQRSDVEERRFCATWTSAGQVSSGALDGRDLDAKGRAAAVAGIGEPFDLLFEQAHPRDANRRLIKHLRHERAALLTFLTIAGVDATDWRGVASKRSDGSRQSQSLGWQSHRSGAETQGRVMTFLRTAHQQGADAIDLLVGLGRAPTPGVIAGLILRPD